MAKIERQCPFKDFYKSAYWNQKVPWLMRPTVPWFWYRNSVSFIFVETNHWLDFNLIFFWYFYPGSTQIVWNCGFSIQILSWLVGPLEKKTGLVMCLSLFVLYIRYRNMGPQRNRSMGSRWWQTYVLYNTQA